MRFSPVLSVLGILCMAVSAHAQWGWGGAYRPSTAAESYQRGFADVVRSAGAANVMNSAALINVEEARSKNIENDLKATETYFEKKRINQEYREQTKRPRPTSEQLFRLAKEAAPGRPDSTELDPVTGGISWPAALTKADYAENRRTLERLFAERTQSSNQLNLEQSEEIRLNIRAMQDKLKAEITDIPPQAFTQANAFLKRLDHEVRFPG